MMKSLILEVGFAGGSDFVTRGGNFVSKGSRFATGLGQLMVGGLY